MISRRKSATASTSCAANGAAFWIAKSSLESLKTHSCIWDFEHEDPACALKSIVTFTLTPTGKGTHLRMERSGFRHLQKQALGGARAGWNQFFNTLEQVAEKANWAMGSKTPRKSAKPAKKAAAKAKPRLLSGGNPQIAKGFGEEPIKVHIAAMPGWKSDLGRRLDALSPAPSPPCASR